MNSNIKNEIKAANGKAQYDARAKRLLSNKYILAYILQEAVVEFKKESVQTIIECIENDIRISSVSAEPGETNRGRNTGHSEDGNAQDCGKTDAGNCGEANAEKQEFKGQNAKKMIAGEQITGINTEDKVPDEGTIYFDIMFSARLPEKENEEEKDKTRLKIIVNVEAQKKKPTGYQLPNRAVYYACRMISSQKTKEFDGSNYNGIKRVYSIWICMNMPEDSLHKIHLIDDCVFGKAGLTGGTDLINIIFVELAKEVSDAETGHRLHRLLGAVFSEKMAAEKKLEIMNREYAIPLEQDVKEEVNIMCNLGEGIEERALERGLEQGREQTLLTLIKKKIDKGKSLEQIAEELEETQEAILPLYRRLKVE